VDAAMAGCRHVVHFAAETHVDRSLVDSAPFHRTNVIGTGVLLDASHRHGVERFLHVSTDEVYGDLAGETRRSLEDDPMAPGNPYSVSKAEAERLVLEAHQSHGLDTVITRGSNTYGPRQFPEKIVPLFTINAIDGKPLPIYGSGAAVRDYLHVDDHCAGIDAVFQRGAPGRAYNLGARLEVNGREVAGKILAILDRPDTLMSYVADREGHDYRYAVDPSAAESLGWSRSWSFEDGLAHTVDWYRQNESWWREINST
jgi:dTDP-glucose 4,6-dehydratase